MINAAELRFNNWIINPDGSYGRVCALGTITFVGGNTCEYLETHNWEDSDNSANFSPIPLEPEILERVGFKLRSTWYKANGNGLFTIKESTVADGEYMVWWNSVTCFIVPMQYLHQLQNLYFSLTGEELTINL